MTVKNNLYSIASALHKGLPGLKEDLFIAEIERALGSEFTICGGDFSSYGAGSPSENNIIYVRTGGTEDLFKALRLRGPIRLLTSGRNNSLAAAMEILSYVTSGGGQGEILHGNPEYIAGRLSGGMDGIENAGSQGCWTKPMPAVDLGGVRLGVIGQPSDWLISSGVDYRRVKEKFSATLVDIGIDELVEDVRNSGCDLRSFEGSEAIHSSLLKIIDRYGLSGLTLRCFDLLDSLGNTGCLALARLNAAGIPSSCEGDIPALLSMMVAHKLTGCPGFQCNLSRIEGDEFLFAHCTVPLSMVKKYTYDTHFESGIGTAIKGELQEGVCTVFKVSPDLERVVAIPAEVVRNQSEPGLCRTQIIVYAKGASDYFLRAPLANHHIVVPGSLFSLL